MFVLREPSSALSDRALLIRSSNLPVICTNNSTNVLLRFWNNLLYSGLFLGSGNDIAIASSDDIQTSICISRS